MPCSPCTQYRGLPSKLLPGQKVVRLLDCYALSAKRSVGCCVYQSTAYSMEMALSGQVEGCKLLQRTHVQRNLELLRGPRFAGDFVTETGSLAGMPRLAALLPL